MPDRIQETLSALRVDADRTGLPDSGAVRRRGDRRDHRQALGSALAVVAIVAIVAGVIGVGGNLTGDDRADAPPADPTVSTTQEKVLGLAADPFLRAGDLTGIGPYGAFTDTGQQPTHRLLQCVDVPQLASDAKRFSTTFAEPDLADATVQEHLLEFASEPAAHEFLARVQQSFAACEPGPGVEVVDRDPQGIGDQGAIRASRLTTPTADAGIGYYELAVIRTADVVVVLEWSSMGNPEGDARGWVWDAERLRTALDRAVG